MHTLARRSLLATLLGPAAGPRRRAGARRARASSRRTRGRRDRHRRGDDPGAAAAMNRHRLSSAQLVAVLPPPDQEARTRSSTPSSPWHPMRWTRPRRRQGAPGRVTDRPLLGIPVIVKDNVNTTDMPTTAGSWALAGSTPGGRVHRPAAPRRRRDRHRQGEPVRMGELPVAPVVERLERHRRPDEHGLRAGSQPVRLQLRHRRRRVGRPRDGRRRHGDRRLDRLPVRRERDRRDQADARAAQPGGRHARSRPSRTPPAR